MEEDTFEIVLHKIEYHKIKDELDQIIKYEVNENSNKDAEQIRIAINYRDFYKVLGSIQKELKILYPYYTLILIINKYSKLIDKEFIELYLDCYEEQIKNDDYFDEEFTYINLIRACLGKCDSNIIKIFLHRMLRSPETKFDIYTLAPQENLDDYIDILKQYCRQILPTHKKLVDLEQKRGREIETLWIPIEHNCYKFIHSLFEEIGNFEDSEELIKIFISRSNLYYAIMNNRLEIADLIFEKLDRKYKDRDFTSCKKFVPLFPDSNHAQKFNNESVDYLMKMIDEGIFDLKGYAADSVNFAIVNDNEYLFDSLVNRYDNIRPDDLLIKVERYDRGVYGYADPEIKEDEIPDNAAKHKDLDILRERLQKYRERFEVITNGERKNRPYRTIVWIFIIIYTVLFSILFLIPALFKFFNYLVGSKPRKFGDVIPLIEDVVFGIGLYYMFKYILSYYPDKIPDGINYY
jgi:hypothetical protein